MADEEDKYEDDFHAESDEETSKPSESKVGGGASGGAGGAIEEAKSGEVSEGDEDTEGWECVDFSEIELEKKPVGGGGFALVFRGEWRGRRVAVKTLFDPKIDAALKKEYMDELHVMRQLKHDNIVEFLGACVRPPKLCFLMELCDTSLFNLLHETTTPLSHEQLVKYAIDMAEGINYLHTRRPMLIHRDLKTHNMLVARNGAIKLCDFGLVSTRNTTAGTPNYMAPELLADLPFSKAVDVYAFGIILWEMFCRTIPFHGWRPTDIKEHVTAGDRLPIPKYELPDLISSLITQCWAQEPKDRPVMAEIIPQLRDWKPYVSHVSAMEATMGGGGDALDSLLGF